MKIIIKHTPRSEFRVDISSAVDVGGATVVGGIWTLEEGDTVSTGIIFFSLLSGLTFDATGISDSSAPWKRRV